MDGRQARGRVLAQAQGDRIKPVDGPLWFVPSSEKAGGYLVNVETGGCSCPDHSGQGVKCKHLYAVEMVRALPASTSAPATPAPATIPPAPPVKVRGDLTVEEQANIKATLRFLRIRAGGFETLAKGLRVKSKSLRAGSPPTLKLALRLARFAGVPIDDVLAGRFPPRCQECGQVLPEAAV